MSTPQSSKGVFWISWLFGIVFIIAIYLIVVKIEENAYNNFINKEWPTHTIKYSEEISPLVGEYINKLITDDRGRVWIITDRAINIVAPDGSWTTLMKDNKNISIQSLAIDKLERIWVGTFDGLYVLNPNGQWATHDEVSKTVYEHYTSSAIVIDRFDRIWVANNDGLRLFLPDGTKLFYTRENSGLPDDYITALAEDRQGNIWIGTRTKGVVVIDSNGQWKTYQANESNNGLVENWVTAILIDDQDRVWVGTERHGVSMLSPDGNWTTYDVTSWGKQSNPEYYDQQINALTMDDKGRLWIGTGDGLFALEPNNNWIAYTQANSRFNSDWVRALTTDRSGRLWIATFHEVIVLDPRNGLPKTVSSDWLYLLNAMLIPLGVIKVVNLLLFAPLEVFNTYSLEICGVSYLALLGLIFPALIGMRWGIKKSNRSLFNIFQWITVGATFGVVLLWILAFLMTLFIYRD